MLPESSLLFAVTGSDSGVLYCGRGSGTSSARSTPPSSEPGGARRSTRRSAVRRRRRSRHKRRGRAVRRRSSRRSTPSRPTPRAQARPTIGVRPRATARRICWWRCSRSSADQRGCGASNPLGFVEPGGATSVQLMNMRAMVAPAPALRQTRAGRSGPRTPRGRRSRLRAAGLRTPGRPVGRMRARPGARGAARSVRGRAGACFPRDFWAVIW